MSQERRDRPPCDGPPEHVRPDHLCVRGLIDEARREIGEGRYYPQEQIERDLASWLEQ
jgi:hypothetical protein